MQKLRRLFSSLVFVTLVPEVASAHSFGVLYNLPVPFWMYLYGGAAAIALSFLLIGYFFNAKAQEVSYPTTPLSRFGLSFLTKSWFVQTAKGISVFLFLLTIVTGLFGDDSSYANFNMTFFWIICALGVTYLTALIGNFYTVINPWKILTTWLGDKGVFVYPKGLGYYPALLFYFLFIWFELLGKVSPAKLSVALVIYTVLTYLGVTLFGRTAWFRYGEFFSVFFRLISKMAPVEYRAAKLYLRPPFIGLIQESAEHFSLIFFVLFMLSSTAYDGIKDTLPFIRFYWQNIYPSIAPIFGVNANLVFYTTCLLLSPLVFFAAYVLLIAVAKTIARSAFSLKDLLLQFAFPLIPIALVYNIAHYYTLVFTQGPSIIRLVSDPFGFGWNLLGTAGDSSTVILNAGFVWHSQVFFIIAGHVTGVYLSHVVARRVFPSSRKRVLISQLPMLVLMIVYTMAGLWILSQPITGGTL
jgi:hypothetical protein